jgi:hypothetical protein
VLAELADDPQADLLMPKAVRGYCVVIAHQLRDRRRFSRSVARELKALTGGALRRIPEAELERALAGLDDERRTIIRKAAA